MKSAKDWTMGILDGNTYTMVMFFLNENVWDNQQRSESPKGT